MKGLTKWHLRERKMRRQGIPWVSHSTYEEDFGRKTRIENKKIRSTIASSTQEYTHFRTGIWDLDGQVFPDNPDVLVANTMGSVGIMRSLKVLSKVERPLSATLLQIYCPIFQGVLSENALKFGEFAFCALDIDVVFRCRVAVAAIVVGVLSWPDTVEAALDCWGAGYDGGGWDGTRLECRSVGIQTRETFLLPDVGCHEERELLGVIGR